MYLMGPVVRGRWEFEVDWGPQLLSAKRQAPSAKRQAPSAKLLSTFGWWKLKMGKLAAGRDELCREFPGNF